MPRINYAPLRDRESRTIRAATDVIRRLLEAVGGKQIRVKQIGMSAHQMGTCRMGNDAGSSVVDADLKVHGLDNLYTVGSSVFPTFGAVEPTLSIAGQALRLGSHLGRRFGRDRRRTELPGHPITGRRDQPSARVT